MTNGRRSKIIVFLVLLLVYSASGCSMPSRAPADQKAAAGPAGEVPEMNGDYRSKSLSSFDLSNSADLLKTLSFDTATTWPSPDKMAAGFDPAKVLAYGKAPGLGLAKLHAEGITGKGVNVAYVDQPLLRSHKALQGIALKYTKVRLVAGQGDTTSMHGPAVASLLAGPEIGVAPGVTLFYYAHPPWLGDQTTHADALRAVIQANRELPAGQKIRVVGFSDGPDRSESNIEAYKAAITEAESEGILVVDVLHPFNLVPVVTSPPMDKNDPKSWRVAPWANHLPGDGALHVPTGGRTTAVGYPEKDDAYAYWAEGGLSWAVPYVVGTLALGWQVDPDLSNENAVKYLMESGVPFRGGKLINPQGFVDLVRQRKN